MTIEISSGFLLINSKTKKILILKTHRENEWDLPKGHKEENETLLENAYRETLEEVSISKNEIEIINDENNNPIKYSFEYISPVSDNTRQIHYFLGLTDKTPIISDEHCGYIWSEFSESLNYINYDDSKEAIKHLYKFIEK